MLDAGICTVYSLISASNEGAMMKEVLKEKASSYFGLLKLGINRVYLAKKADEKIELVIKIWQDQTIRPEKDYCILNDGIHGSDQFLIRTVQHTEDDDGLKISILSLEKSEKIYEILKT